jgi:Zn-dependent protease
VHSSDLKALAEQGSVAEKAGDLTTALEAWRKALELLPSASAQRERVLAKVQALSTAVTASGALPRSGSTENAEKPRAGAGKWLAGLGATGALLLKFKALPLFLLTKAKFLLVGLTQAKTFFTMILALGVYTSIFGWWFALGFIVSIYIHEMGHVAALRRYGIAATAPMFVPGFGAFVRLNQRPATVAEDARVGLAGPIWGAGAAAAALALGKALDAPLLLAIGHVGAWINLFNLLPVWQLDGARAFSALSRRDRGIVAGALWLCAFSGVDGMLVILALVATVRAWMQSPTTPVVGDRAVLVTFIVLAVALTAMMAVGGGLPAR